MLRLLGRLLRVSQSVLRLETDALLALLFQLPPRLTRLEPEAARSLYSHSLYIFYEQKSIKSQFIWAPLRALFIRAAFFRSL